ncbi:MAG TPA: hypothetical protein PLX89_25405, partial [Verrucomicrobiota bacterium]|nr:hypothetical protein [Verrucomicrobiales bacterium]HRI16343.1 hypothetical protein [Verrucomicrobiota bacterium]
MSGETNQPTFESSGFPGSSGPMLPQAVPIQILLLTDDDGSFNEEDKFGLTALIDALDGTGGVFAKFKVTKAHRDQATAVFTEPANADIQQFRFDNPEHFNPAHFDEVWMIGIRE